MTTTRRADQQGAALVEFALVLVPLMILIIGTLAYGLTLGLQQSTTHAAAAAAREASVVVGTDSVDRQAAIQARAQTVVDQQLSWLGGVSPTATTTFPEGRVRVTVTTDNPFSAIGAFGVRPPAQLGSTATMRLEDIG